MGIIYELMKKYNKCKRSDKKRKLNNETVDVETCPPCPTCGRNPYTGTKPVFPLTDSEYVYITCGHCSTHYEYKK